MANKIQPFDGYEIHPCKRHDNGSSQWVEQCESSETPDMWSLYGHMPEGGVQCIGDFTTREHAVEILQRITGALAAVVGFLDESAITVADDPTPLYADGMDLQPLAKQIVANEFLAAVRVAKEIIASADKEAS